MEHQLMTVAVDPAAAAGRADAVVVRVTGEIGISSLVGPDGGHTGVGGDTALDAALAVAIPSPPPKVVVIDLSGATYLSSMGMGALLRVKQTLAEAGGELRLAGGGTMLTLLRRCRLEDVLRLYPDVAGALAG